MKGGMDDVIAAETLLSHIDGEAGRLVIRGHDLEELAGEMRFEDATSLLWEGLIETGGRDRLSSAIGGGRVRAFARFEPFHDRLADRTPVEAMRFLLASIADESELAAPAALVGATGVAAAMAIRASQGRVPVAPDAGAGHAADLLRMVRGHAPDDAEAGALDAYLVTVIDHGLNASTFAARVVASTRAGAVSSVIAGLCALKGPLHGGAPGPVLDMLDAIGTASNAEPWLNDALGRGERLMGFGHRVYRIRDPRADVLKKALGALEGRGNRLALAEQVEKAALCLLAERKIGLRLDVNVEFYTALLLEALGLPRSGFTPIFAAGRVSGWLAHASEQEASGRLIRPKSHYIGPMPERAA